MKTIGLILGFGMLAAIANSQSVVIKNDPHSQVNTPYDQVYDQSTLTTIKGTIVGIGVTRPNSSMPANVRIIVSQAPHAVRTTVVELGPRWFVNSQKARPRLGQTVRVTGSRIVDHGEPKLLASQVVLPNHDVLTLRKSSGIPYWVDLTPTVDVTGATADDYSSGQTRLAAEGAILQAKVFTVNGVQYAGYVVQTADGPKDVIVAPPEFPQPQSFYIGDNVRIMSSGYLPMRVGQGVIVMASMSDTSGNFYIGPNGQTYQGFRPW